MNYSEPVFRPPSEADSFILQITYGCSHNKCTFCGMYRNKKFFIRPMDDIIKDITAAGKLFPGTRRVFLADGDALVLKTEILLKVLEELNKVFPQLQRVGIYGNPHGILRKDKEEIRQLKELKLGIVYLGLESGSEEILRDVNKGFTAEDMIECVRYSQEYDIKMSVIILLGLGGVKYSRLHAIKTAEALNRMEPRYLSALTLMPVGGTPLYEAVKKGDFILPKAEDLLKELRLLIENLNLKGTIFRSNHASNYLPLAGRFPKDKERLLAEIDYTIEHGNLIPEFFRGL
ncbi:MAG TPA: radical SAM protein [Candidatus Eremiobacteraeota bacterium]|nr:radical SAM protein [Candidatus Eremiobacteraeota bacterium]